MARFEDAEEGTYSFQSGSGFTGIQGECFVGMLLMYISRFEGRKKWERKRCPAEPGLVRRDSRIYITIVDQITYPHRNIERNYILCTSTLPAGYVRISIPRRLCPPHP